MSNKLKNDPSLINRERNKDSFANELRKEADLNRPSWSKASSQESKLSKQQEDLRSLNTGLGVKERFRKSNLNGKIQPKTSFDLSDVNLDLPVATTANLFQHQLNTSKAKTEANRRISELVREAKQDEINSILSEIAEDDDFDEISLVGKFKTGYKKARAKKVGFIGRMKKIGSGIFSAVVNVKNIAVGAVKQVPKVAKILTKGIVTTADVLTTKKTYTKAWDGIKKGAKFLKNLDWKELGSNVAHGAWKGVKFIAKGVWSFGVAVVTDPKQALDIVVGGTKKALGLLKEVSDSIGLTSLAVGIFKLVRSPYTLAIGLFKSNIEAVKDLRKVLSGNLTIGELGNNLKSNLQAAHSNYVSDLKGSVQAVKGAVLIAGELTGITDCIMTAKYLYEGNYVMAGIHAGFAVMSAGALVATVGTAGVAGGSIVAVAAGRASLKEAGKKVLEKAIVKQGLEAAGKKVAEQALENTSKKALKKGLDTLVEKTLKETEQALVKEIEAEGAEVLTKETVENLVKEAAEKRTFIFMQKTGLNDAIEESGYKLIKSIGSSGKASRKQIISILTDSGMSKEVAESVSKDLKRALRTKIADKEIIAILKEGASKPISEYIKENTEVAFKEGFEKLFHHNKTLKEALEKRIKDTGNLKYLDELSEAASKGYKEGVEKAVRESVEKALKKAMAKYRKFKKVVSGLDGESEEVEIDIERIYGYVEDLNSSELDVKPRVKKKIDKAMKNEALLERFIEKNGVLYKQYYMLGDSGNREVITEIQIEDMAA